MIRTQEWNISRLSYEYDSEPFGKERDAAIKKLASEAGVEVTVRISHTLYDLDKYVPRQTSLTTTTITLFYWKVIKELYPFLFFYSIVPAFHLLFAHFLFSLFSLALSGS